MLFVSSGMIIFEVANNNYNDFKKQKHFNLLYIFAENYARIGLVAYPMEL
jgi:hypothetical protein